MTASVVESVPTNFVESAWKYWFDTVGGFGVFVTAYSLMALIYALGGYIFYIIDNSRWLDKYKIQKGIFMEAVATFLPILIISPHFFTFYSWFIIRQFDAVFTHCGYELPFPFQPFHYLPFFGGTTFHDYHHKAFNCNYASRFTYLDKIFNTYKEEEPAKIGKKE